MSQANKQHAFADALADTRSVIIGTAGHIDHGKSSLVQALTGKDPDRLPEEKRRGITIDLGFADLDLGDVRVGFVDVPGHERFVKNMLAGVHGIDAVALVIAADEGVMPQTREHFDICRLLGVQKGFGSDHKNRPGRGGNDLACAQRSRRIGRPDPFSKAHPIVSVSARTGSGLDELRTMLGRSCVEVPPRSADFCHPPAGRSRVHDEGFWRRGYGHAGLRRNLRGR